MFSLEAFSHAANDAGINYSSTDKLPKLAAPPPPAVLESSGSSWTSQWHCCP